MNVPGNISAILKLKGQHIWTVKPSTKVFEAIQLMADKNCGALLVMDGEQLQGMISERDYTRKIALKGKSSKQASVQEILTSPLITVTPEHTVEDSMRLMTQHRVRHLPVLENEKVVGVVSIGDLVNWIIMMQSATIDQLENYIAGHYPG